MEGQECKTLDRRHCRLINCDTDKLSNRTLLFQNNFTVRTFDQTAILVVKYLNGPAPLFFHSLLKIKPNSGMLQYSKDTSLHTEETEES